MSNTERVDVSKKGKSMFARIQIACLAIWLMPVLVNNAIAAQKETVKIDANALLSVAQNSPNSVAMAAVELGEVKRASKYEVKLKILNGTENSLTLAAVETSCLCSSAAVPAGEIKAGETIEAIVKFDTPEKIANGKFGIQLRLLPSKNASSEVAMINLSCVVRGTLQFDKVQNVFVVKEGLSRWNIPFTFTDPVSIENLEISSSESLGEIVFTYKRRGDFHFIEAAIPQNAVELGSSSGWVEIKDRALAVEDTLEFVLVKNPPVTIAPKQLIFRTKDKGYEAVAIVRVNERKTSALDDSQTNDSSFSTSKSPEISASCKVLDFTLSTKATRISEGIARLKISFSDDTFEMIQKKMADSQADSKSENQMQLNVLFRGASFNIDVSYQVLN